MALNVEDKLAIHELLARWAYGYDERDVPMIEACFLEDAEMTMRIAGGDLIGPFEGREAILFLMTSSMDEQTDVRRHVTTNIFFEDEGESPVVVSTLTLLATENDQSQLLSAGVYRDKLARTSSGWCIAHRHLELDKGY